MWSQQSITLSGTKANSNIYHQISFNVKVYTAGKHICMIPFHSRKLVFLFPSEKETRLRQRNTSFSNIHECPCVCMQAYSHTQKCTCIRTHTYTLFQFVSVCDALCNRSACWVHDSPPLHHKIPFGPNGYKNCNQPQKMKLCSKRDEGHHVASLRASCGQGLDQDGHPQVHSESSTLPTPACLLPLPLPVYFRWGLLSDPNFLEIIGKTHLD